MDFKVFVRHRKHRVLEGPPEVKAYRRNEPEYQDWEVKFTEGFQLDIVKQIENSYWNYLK